MSRVVLNEAGIRHLFSNPQGPVAKIIREKANLIESHARANINSNFDSRTGDLAESLHQVEIQVEPFHIAVGANATHRGYPYALALETGINPLTGGAPTHGKFPYMVPAVGQAGFTPR